MKLKKGYTTIELVSVTVVLALLAIGWFIFIGFLNNMKLEAATQKLVSDIRFTQSQAMSTTLWHGVSFEASNNEYSIYRTDGISQITIEDPAKLGSNFKVNLSLDFGVRIVSVNMEGGGNEIEFNGLGVPYTSYSGWVVSQEGSVVLGIDSLTKTIIIVPTTGKVRVL